MWSVRQTHILRSLRILRKIEIMTRLTRTKMRTADECVGISINQLLLTTRTTKKQLGEILGISGPTVGRKIRGEIAWSLNDLYTTADFFGVDITDILPRRVPLSAHNKTPQPSEEDQGAVLVAGAGFEPTTSGSQPTCTLFFSHQSCISTTQQKNKAAHATMLTNAYAAMPQCNLKHNCTNHLPSWKNANFRQPMAASYSPGLANHTPRLGTFTPCTRTSASYRRHTHTPPTPPCTRPRCPHPKRSHTNNAHKLERPTNLGTRNASCLPRIHQTLLQMGRIPMGHLQPSGKNPPQNQTHHTTCQTDPRANPPHSRRNKSASHRTHPPSRSRIRSAQNRNRFTAQQRPRANRRRMGTGNPW